MNTEDGNDSFIARWSRRKLRAREDAPTVAVEKSRLVQPVPPAPPDDLKATGVTPVTDAPQANTQPDLPAVESLTPESDFGPFMQPGVDSRLRNQALKTLFRDPAFNVMDRLDIYIDDYSKPDPIPDEMLRRLNQAKSLFLFDDEKKNATTASAETAVESAITANAGQPAADQNDPQIVRDIKQNPGSEAGGNSKAD
jgi:hypothetical protein